MIALMIVCLRVLPPPERVGRLGAIPGGTSELSFVQLLSRAAERMLAAWGEDDIV